MTGMYPQIEPLQPGAQWEILPLRPIASEDGTKDKGAVFEQSMNASSWSESMSSMCVQNGEYSTAKSLSAVVCLRAATMAYVKHCEV